MQEYRPGTGNRRRRRRTPRHPNPRGEGHTKQKQNPLQALVAGIASLFGKKKQRPPVELGSGDRGRGRQRDRRERTDRSEQDRSIRDAAEAPIGDAAVFKSEPVSEQSQEGLAPAKPMEQTEVTTPRLYIGNLSYDSSESDLFDLFSQSGSVRNVEIAMDKKTHRSKGFGFVEMDSVTSAEAAQKKLNGHEMMGRQLLVMGAKSQRSSERSERGERGDRDERRGGRRGGERRR